MRRKEYLIWEQWRENGGTSPRPSSVPRNIPKSWWALYKSRHLTAKPIQVYDGFFAQSKGALFRTPGGNVENVDEQKVYLGWSALNLRPTQGDWSKQLQKNSQYGVTTLPWQHCFDEEDIDEIFDIAPKWNVRAHSVLNVEQEAMTILNPEFVSYKIAGHKAKYPQAEVAIVPLPWVQNGAGWQHLANVPTLVEIFTNERSEYTAAACVQHANNEGLKIVGCLWGAYPIKDVHPDPGLYPLNSYKIQAIYTGDDVQDWEDWV